MNWWISESAESLQPFLEELQELFAVEVLLSDDQDNYKNMVAELGLSHDICRVHVNRNGSTKCHPEVSPNWSATLGNKRCAVPKQM